MRVILLTLAAATMLAGCGQDEKAELNKMDKALTSKAGADPALTAALEDQIMVDPALSGQANGDSVRPANEPFQAPIPAEGDSPAASQSLGDLAAEQAEFARNRFNGCPLDVEYSVDWSNRLPSDLPLPRQARVTEAAGADAEGCKLRAVSFTINAPVASVVRYYQSVAQKGGFTNGVKNERAGKMVSGTRAADGASFYVIVQPAGNGSSADLVVNNGR